ncbi:hypothetical protein [Gimesia maris]|jgi:hypothetical protein|uniref:BON domain-containing protein n=1 Tax=Gimesia maris TaxID=122 RepID=A0A3D3R1M7_9PLAN|nr:hypothetical protein [Gimesia maris]|tara:strand:- start:4405 stop:4752 length:348 start_codon:yes stop_codon:yes gene_type:complete
MITTLLKKETNLSLLSNSVPVPLTEQLLPASAETLMEDSLIQFTVEQRLQDLKHLALPAVCCFVEDRVVMLGGVVPSYYLKQVIQTAVIKVVRDLESDIQIENHCQVVCSSNNKY